MEPNQERDEWLMAQVASGQQKCLEPLIRRHASPLLTFIRRMVGDHHQSEELFQEAFLAVWVKRRQYQFPRPFKPWLYAIALNKCRAAFRDRDVPTTAYADDNSAMPVGHASPAETAIATETATLVRQAVSRLPQQQRVVVVLRLWDGLPYGQIADILGRTETTVRSNMHHGLATMRKFLEPRLR